MNRALVALLVLAALVRIAFVVPALDRPLGGDALGYDAIARNVATGHGFTWGTGDEPRLPTSIRGPSYLLFLAGLEWVFGDRHVVLLLAQVGLDLVSCLLVFAIARRTFPGTRVALLAALFYAGYLPFAIATSELLTETFVNVTVLGTLWFFLRWVDGRRPVDLFLAALVLGVAVLAKSHLALLLPVLLLAALPELGVRRAAGALVAGSVVLALCLAPWTIRNARVFHAFVPGTTHGGITFWGGTGPADGKTVGGTQDPHSPPHVSRAIAHMDEVERDRWFYAEGRRVIREHPWRYVRVVAMKVPRLWFNLGFDDPPSRASVAVAVLNVILIVLAFLGIRRPDARPLMVRILVGLGIYFTLIHLPFAAVLRYAFPVYAVILIFTAAGVLPVLSRERRLSS